MANIEGLDPTARESFRDIEKALKNLKIRYTITSAFRSRKDQEALVDRYNRGEPGIFTPAQPGTSPHEKGLAVDISISDPGQHAQARQVLEQAGWKWAGPKDPVHFTYQPVQISESTQRVQNDLLSSMDTWDGRLPKTTATKPAVKPQSVQSGLLASMDKWEAQQPTRTMPATEEIPQGSPFEQSQSMTVTPKQSLLEVPAQGIPRELRGAKAQKAVREARGKPLFTVGLDQPPTQRTTSRELVEAQGRGNPWGLLSATWNHLAQIGRADNAVLNDLGRTITYLSNNYQPGPRESYWVQKRSKGELSPTEEIKAFKETAKERVNNIGGILKSRVPELANTWNQVMSDPYFRDNPVNLRVMRDSLPSNAGPFAKTIAGALDFISESQIDPPSQVLINPAAKVAGKTIPPLAKSAGRAFLRTPVGQAAEKKAVQLGETRAGEFAKTGARIFGFGPHKKIEQEVLRPYYHGLELQSQRALDVARAVEDDVVRAQSNPQFNKAIRAYANTHEGQHPGPELVHRWAEGLRMGGVEGAAELHKVMLDAQKYGLRTPVISNAGDEIFKHWKETESALTLQGRGPALILKKKPPVISPRQQISIEQGLSRAERKAAKETDKAITAVRKAEQEAVRKAENKAIAGIVGQPNAVGRVQVVRQRLRSGQSAESIIGSQKQQAYEKSVQRAYKKTTDAIQGVIKKGTTEAIQGITQKETRDVARSTAKAEKELGLKQLAAETRSEGALKRGSAKSLREFTEDAMGGSRVRFGKKGYLQQPVPVTPHKVPIVQTPAKTVTGVDIKQVREVGARNLVDRLAAEGKYVQPIVNGEVKPGWTEIKPGQSGFGSIVGKQMPTFLYKTIDNEFGEAGLRGTAQGWKEYIYVKDVMEWLEKNTVGAVKRALIGNIGTQTANISSNTIVTDIGLQREGVSAAGRASLPKQVITAWKDVSNLLDRNVRHADIAEADQHTRSFVQTQIDAALGRPRYGIGQARRMMFTGTPFARPAPGVTEVLGKALPTNPLGLTDAHVEFQRRAELAYKLAMYRILKKEGLSPEQAAKAVEKYLFDYSDRSVVSEIMDRFGFWPFNVYPQKAFELAVDTIKHRPEMVASLPRKKEIALESFGRKEEYEQLPRYKKGPLVFPLPEEIGGQKFLDLSRVHPLGGSFEVLQKAYEAAQAIPHPARRAEVLNQWTSDILRKPIWTPFLSIMGQGLRPYGEAGELKPIVHPGAPPEERGPFGTPRLKELAKSYLPSLSFIPGTKYGGRGFQAITEALQGVTPTDYKYGEPRSIQEALVQYTLGIRLSPQEGEDEKTGRLIETRMKRIFTAAEYALPILMQALENPETIDADLRASVERLTPEEVDRKLYESKQNMRQLESSGEVTTPKGLYDPERLRRAALYRAALINRHMKDLEKASAKARETP